MRSFSSTVALAAAVAAISSSGVVEEVAACGKLWNDICFTYAAGDDVFWGSNCDFTGTDIGSGRGGADKCGSLCKNFNGCERWSWSSYNQGTCYFKGKSSWGLVAASGVQCGFRKFPHA